MDPDPEIVNWILEFFLRQSIEIRTLKSLLRALPPPTDNLNLKKLFLLKKLESELSCNSVSETILDLFYHLEQVEFLLGNERVSDTMKRAFCTAAVECTVRNLEGKGCEDKAVKRFKFFEAFKRVWKGKTARMEKVEKGGLGSEALWAWKDEMEKAVWDDAAYDGVLKKGGEVNGVEAVNAYIREEREKMGPSFLEKVAERLKSDEILQRILGVKEMNKGELVSGNLRGGSIVDHNETMSGPLRSTEVEKAGKVYCPLIIKTPKSRIDGIDQVAGKEAPSSGVNGSNASKEMNKGELASGKRRGASIVDHNETTSGPSRSAEINKAGKAVQHPPEDNHASAAGVAQAPGDSMSNGPSPSSIKRNSAARIREKSGEVHGVEAVNAYIREDREKMGPSFLELVAEKVKSDEILQRILGVDGVDQVAGEEAPSSGVKELNKGELESGNPRGATIVDHSKTTSGLSRSAEVEKAGGAIQHPPEDNQASGVGVAQAPSGNMSNEPRPSSIKCNKAARTHETPKSRIDGIDQVAGKEAPSTGVNGSNASKEMNKGELASRNRRGASIVDHNETTSGLSRSAEADKAGEPVQHPPEDNHASAAGVAQAPGDNMRNEPRPRSIKRNKAACTCELDESVVRSQEYRGMNLKKRRQNRPWSLLEEDTLRNEVEKHGKGYWKLILKLNRETFVDRTDVDLKDKWRNMTEVRNTPRL